MTTSGRRKTFDSAAPAELGCILVVGTVCLLLCLPSMLALRLRLPDRLEGLAPLGYAASLAVSLATSVLASIPLCRLQLRLQPVRVDDTRSLVQKALVHLYEQAITVAFPGAFMYWVVWPIGSIALEAPYPGEQSIGTVTQLSQYAGLLIPVCVCLGLPTAVCLSLHMKWSRLLVDGRYVLFLRRFTSPGDFAVAPSLLTATPSGIPLVMLVEQADRRIGPIDSRQGGNWDPLTVGFAGLKFKKPFASMPVFIEATNDLWFEAVRQLSERARCVAIDVSEMSPAVFAEDQLIRETRSDTGVLRLVSESATDGATGLLGTGVEQALNTVSYSTSWNPWRLIVQCIAWAAALAMACTVIVHNFGPPGVLRSFSVIGLSIGLSLIHIAVFILVVVRRSMSHESTAVVRDRLQAVLSAGMRAAE